MADSNNEKKKKIIEQQRTFKLRIFLYTGALFICAYLPDNPLINFCIKVLNLIPMFLDKKVMLTFTILLLLLILISTIELIIRIPKLVHKIRKSSNKA